MPRIIKNRQIVEDDQQVLALAAGETPDTVPLPAAPVLLPLSVWHPPSIPSVGHVSAAVVPSTQMPCITVCAGTAAL